MSSITGKLSALQVAIGPLTSLFCRSMHKTIACATTWDRTVRLGEITLEELHFWLTVDWSLFITLVWPELAPSPTAELFVDASASGWGAWVATPTYQTSRCCFSLTKREGSSTLREVLGLMFALHAFVAIVRNYKCVFSRTTKTSPKSNARDLQFPPWAQLQNNYACLRRLKIFR